MSERAATLSLRWKALAFVLAVSASFVVATYLLQLLIVQPEFARIEAREADANLARAVEAISRDADFLAKSARDYAAWDDTYAFVDERGTEYVEANLIPETLSNLGVDALVITSAGGEVIWGKRCCAEDGSLADDAALIGSLVAPENGLVDHESPKSRRFGVLLGSTGLLLVGSAAVTDSSQKAPVRGSVIFAREIDAEELTSLTERTRVALALAPLAAPAAEDRAAAGLVARDGSPWHDTSDPNVLRAYTTIRNVTGEPALLVRADLPRETSRRAIAAGRLAALTSTVGGLAILAVMWWGMARFLVRPLEAVTAHAVRVGQHGDLRSRLDLETNDEIGVLAREFDRMVERLAHAQAQIIEVAHDAGRAEVATAVLHDVGNVLNSVTVSASVATNTLAQSEVASFRQALDLLARNEGRLAAFLTSDPRGRHLLPFLSELVTQLENEHRIVETELKSLGASLEHIRTLVRAQNQHSVAKPLLEDVEPSTVVEQAIALCGDSFRRHDIRLERTLAAHEPVRMDRHRCLQVLANLLGNAKNAIVDTGRAGGTIGIALAGEHDASGDWIQLSVSDDGVGIPAEALERIFALGFSTRPNGRGIGLHSAANLAREMGGSLRAASAGPGHGAVFTLRIPAARGTMS